MDKIIQDDEILQVLKDNLTIHKSAHEKTEPEYVRIVAERQYLGRACDNIEKMIAERKSFLLGAVPVHQQETPSRETSSDNGQGQPNNSQVAEAESKITPVIFKDLSLIKAVTILLRTIKTGQSTRQIADALLLGGYKTTARDFTDTVRGTLKQYRHPKGEILWIDNKWELKEWHPELE